MWPTQKTTFILILYNGPYEDISFCSNFSSFNRFCLLQSQVISACIPETESIVPS